MLSIKGLRNAYFGPPKSYRKSEGHWIFSKYLRYTGPFEGGFEYDFIGTASSHEFMNATWPTQQATSLPGIDEEYFEWIDVLLSAYRARGRYVMLEWGAGFGRWGVRAGQAARLRGLKDILIGFAEAEPTHAKWLRAHVATNGLREDQVRIDECAISDRNGKTHFYTGMPEGSENNSPGEWYGQAIASGHEKKKDGEEGREVEFASGWKAVEVDLRDSISMLEGFGTIDLLDLDIQGEEEPVIRHCIKALSKQVKRVHVGTHSTKIEDKLRHVFAWNGWIPVRDFGCGGTRATPYGDVVFGDGVQTWVNPRLGEQAE